VNDVRRRDFVRLSAAALAAAACGRTTTSSNPTDVHTASTMPVLFVSHGAPTLALDRRAGADFARAAAALPRPRAVVVLSAHWLDAPATVGTRTQRPLLHDFSGFPPELERVSYAAPAAAAVADEMLRRVPSLMRADERPWDHGVWVPLVHMYPEADVPVVQASVPYRWTPRQLFEFGRQLAPLRQQGVLVLGSGGAVHNLRQLDWNGDGDAPDWAVAFEGWLRDRLLANAADDVVAFRELAPAVSLAHPTVDHFLPLVVALGAAAVEGGEVSFPIEGWEYGSLSRLAVRWG
jgi:4,5-DOPA dioxygenase extradiol